MPLKLLSSGGGSVLLTANTTASDFTVNVPAVNGNMVTTADTGSITQSMLGAGVYAGYGPAFSAYTGSTFSVADQTWVKVPCNSEFFDTNNNYDSTTNYRFTPTIAGYYQVQGACFISPPNQTSGFILSIYKNGSEYQQIHRNQFGTSFNQMASGGIIIYLNGSTDYVELYVWHNGGSTRTFGSSQTNNWFQGYLVRAA